jgi:hypothetical protein
MMAHRLAVAEISEYEWADPSLADDLERRQRFYDQIFEDYCWEPFRRI